MTPLSFRARLVVTMGAIILVISAAVWLYVPRKLEHEAITLMVHKAETLAQLTVFTIHPSVFFRDRVALDEALSGTRADKDVAYIIVMDTGGNRLAAFHQELATAEALARRTAGGTVSPDHSLYEIMQPITDSGGVLARLHVGLSLARLNRQLLQTRIAVGVLSLLILAAGLVAVVLISNIITKPLREVEAGARQIAAGDLGSRVRSHSRDEVGRLADSFNDMAMKIAERDASLRELSKRLLSAQEKECVRIAREVHDELGQALTALKIDLQQISSSERALDEPLRAVARTIDQIIDLVRRIATDLRPAVLDDLGVTAALQQQLRRVRETTGITTTLDVVDEPHLDMLTGVTLYRIVQEGLANVIRHSGATEVHVSVETTDTAAVLTIRDNGRGMTSAQLSDPHSLGLLGIRERAELLGGAVSIESTAGQGTSLAVTLPLAKDDQPC